MIWMLILLTYCHTFLFKVCSQNLVLHHWTILSNWWFSLLSGWQCINNVRRNYLLITPGWERVKLNGTCKIITLWNLRKITTISIFPKTYPSSWNSICFVPTETNPAILALGIVVPLLILAMLAVAAVFGYRRWKRKKQGYQATDGGMPLHPVTVETVSNYNNNNNNSNNNNNNLFNTSVTQINIVFDFFGGYHEELRKGQSSITNTDKELSFLTERCQKWIECNITSPDPFSQVM